MVVLTKNWGKYKKGDKLNITDKTVLEKGLKTGLFAKPENKKKKSKK